MPPTEARPTDANDAVASMRSSLVTGGARSRRAPDTISLAVSRSTPVGRPWKSLSMLPPGGSGVEGSIPANSSAIVLATAMWPQ